MKVFLNVLRTSLAIIMMMGWTGCGGSPGDGNDDSTTQTDQAIKIVEQENENANKFARQAILYFGAVEEYLETLEEGTAGIDLTGMTVDELVDILGQEQVENLADKILSIYVQKIEPAAEAMNTAYNDLVLSEQQYEDFLDPVAASMLQPADFGTGFVICAAAGVVLTAMGSIAYCAMEFKEENEACIEDRMDQGYKENIATLLCTLQNPEAIEKCGIEMAVSTYITALSLGAPYYKKFQLAIDSYSITDALNKIKAIFGVRGCSTTQGLVGQNRNGDLIRSADATTPAASYFFGISDEGMFLVPEGDWTFIAVADGYARGLTGCVSVSGTEEIIKKDVTMVPADKVDELVSDQDSDGYTICQNECDDFDDTINPGADEVCDDLVDNNCDGDFDCEDVGCSNDPACESTGLSLFNQVSFSLTSIFIGDEKPDEPYNHTSDLGDYGFDGSFSGNKYSLVINSKVSEDGRWERTMDPFEIIFDENYKNITKIDYITTNYDHQSQYKEIYGIKSKPGSSIPIDLESSSKRVFKVDGAKVCEIVESFYKRRYREGEEEPFDYIEHKKCDGASKFIVSFSIR